MHRERLLRDLGHSVEFLIDQLKLLALGVTQSSTLSKNVEQLNHGIEWITQLVRDGRSNTPGCGHLLACAQCRFGALAFRKVAEHHHCSEGDSVADHRRGC